MNDRPMDEVNGILNADRYRETSQQILEQHTSLKALQVDRKNELQSSFDYRNKIFKNKLSNQFLAKMSNEKREGKNMSHLHVIWILQQLVAV